PQDGGGGRAVAVRGAAEQLYARADVGPAGERGRRPAADDLGPRLRAGRGGARVSAVVEGRGLVRDYQVRGGLFRAGRVVHAVKGVSFSVEKGRTLAILGESGCVMFTLSRIVTLIEPATSGELLIEGVKVD